MDELQQAVELGSVSSDLGSQLGLSELVLLTLSIIHLLLEEMTKEVLSSAGLEWGLPLLPHNYFYHSDGAVVAMPIWALH